MTGPDAGPGVTVTVTEEVDVAYARHRARQEAERLGFPSAKVYRLVTAVSELANNLCGHTEHGGLIRLAVVQKGARIGIEVQCDDTGPGIPDIALAMQDGYSTNRGLGSGLPGVQRLMDEFSIESEVGVGTRIRARLWRP